MMSVFSKNAPKSVKVSYAFKIYRNYFILHFLEYFSFSSEGIYKGARPGNKNIDINKIKFDLLFVFLDGELASPDAIDIYDIKEIIRRLSGKKFTEDDITKVAEAVCLICFSKSNFIDIL